MHAVGQSVFERVKGASPGEHIPGLVRNALDTIGLVLARVHESQIAHAEVLHAANDVRNVHEILRLVQDDDDHPTSSSTPKRAGS